MRLWALIPIEGTVPLATTKNKALDRFRRASNCYHDLYNNGLCNRLSEFNRLFDVCAKSPRYYCYTASYGPAWRAEFYALIETKMDAIVLAAALEQGFLTEAAHMDVAASTF